MLSICIPIYNFDVRNLVIDLSEQAKNLEQNVEIILIDDCSDENFQDVNEAICTKFSYHKLTKNIGRSKIRNLFIEKAKYENLLFLDSDAGVSNKLYLEKYMNFIENSQFSVLFGGSIYRNEKPERNKLLAWKYGFYQQSKTINERVKNPNSSFMTNNFVIKKAVLQQFPFDERLANYGHEDTVYGILLKKKNVEINHIDNPVYHDGIDENSVFIKKTEMGIKSLLFIQKNIDSSPDFENEIKLIRFYKRLKKFKIHQIVFFGGKIVKKPILFFLKKGFVSLKLFDFYKLIYYMEQKTVYFID